MLELRSLCKKFQTSTGNGRMALNNVTLSLQPNDFVTIIGSNGAGKSTLLNVIAGVFPADSGQIVIDGEDVTSLPEHRRASLMGRVFQDQCREQQDQCLSKRIWPWLISEVCAVGCLRAFR